MRADSGHGICLCRGDDGTLNEVANGILGTHAALGVLAIETANVWAREMGVSLADLVTDAREQINGVWGFG